MIYDIQKAPLLKRFSAYLLDIILIIVLATGFVLLISWISGYDKYAAKWNGYVEQYEQQYNVKLGISQEDFDKFSDEEKQQYQDAVKEINAELSQNPDAIKSRQMMLTLPFVMVSMGLLMSTLILEFVLPLVFKNGQTVGKKVFGLGVVFNNSVRLNTFALFVRAVFGKYTIETLIPVMLLMMSFFYNMMGVVGIIVPALILLLQIVVLIVTKNNCCIHDVLASTAVVDLSSQMIFDSNDELLAYKEEQHKEDVQNQQS